MRVSSRSGSHADNGSGEADGCDHGTFGGAECGAIGDATHDRFLTIAGNTGRANLGEFVEQVCAISDGELGAARQAVDLNDLLGQRRGLETR